MASKVLLHDIASYQDIPVPLDETILGRGSFLQCEDMRVSRNHGLIKVDSSSEPLSIRVTATHLNPIYYRLLEGDCDVCVLKQDQHIQLHPGDQFSLLPDQYWYELRLSEEPEETAEHPTSNGVENCIADSSTTTHHLRVRTLAEMNGSVAVTIPAADSPATTEKRKATDDSDTSVKRNRVEDEPTDGSQLSCSTSSSSSSSTSSSSAPTVDPANPAATTPTKVTVKKEKADTSTLRPSCEYGIRCYRLGVPHRAEFAHPGDHDYRRPDFPPADPDSPMCPYGVRCYRRNPQHFSDYLHPDSTVGADGLDTRRLRTRVPVVDHGRTDDEDDDDDDDDEDSLDDSNDFTPDSTDGEWELGNESGLEE